MKTPSTPQLLKIIIVIDALWILSLVSSIWLPLAVSLVLTFALLPLVRLLTRIKLGKRRYLPRTIAIIISFVVFCAVIGGLAAYIITPLTKQLIALVDNMPSYILRVETLLNSLYSQYQNVVIPDALRAKIMTVLNDLAAVAVSLVGQAVKMAFSITTSIISLILVPFLTYYFLKDGTHTINGIVRLFPCSIREKTAQVMCDLGRVMSDYIKGQIIISAIIGVLVAAGTSILGLQYSLVFGLLAMLLETIPYVGPICAAVPALLLAYIISPLLCLKVLIFYLAVHLIEANVVVPNVMGKTVDIHPGILMVALLVGGELYGIIGMMLAVPVTAAARVILRAIWFYGDEIND